jgi:geranylgeranyl diphosphate synthase type II
VTTTDEPGTLHVEQVLAEVGDMVRRAMLDQLPDGEPHSWLYALMREYPARPGKALRPSLCLATCRAFGGSTAAALPVAVAIELLHNAFLIHDDIVDGSATRRRGPTLPAAHGPELALNAGDALLVVGQRLLRQHTGTLSPAVAARVCDEFDTMALRTLEGQAIELGWRRDGVVDVGPDDYLDLIMHKTCWYTTIHPLRVGALLGAGTGVDLRPMVRFGFMLGAAFQIRDDVLNLVGDVDRYGKELGGDLREGKRTLMLIHLLGEVRGSDRRTLDRYLAMAPAERTPEVIAEVLALMDRYGSIDFAMEYGQGLARTAGPAFDAAFSAASSGPDMDFIRSLVPYMLGRAS